jgi:hypothetical protein
MNGPPIAEKRQEGAIMAALKGYGGEFDRSRSRWAIVGAS